MSTLAIKGHATRGSEVIALLEMLGGINKYNFLTTEENLLYCRREEDDAIIITYPDSKVQKVFTLEEFEEKFPYKVGDKVSSVESPEKHYTIVSMMWDGSVIRYDAQEINTNSCLFLYKAEKLQCYKEEKTYPPYMDYDVKQETMEEKDKSRAPILYSEDYANHTFGYKIPNEYEFIGVENNEIRIRKKKPIYPSNYEECCRIVNASPYVKLVYNLDDGQTYSYDVDNLHVYENLRQLRICRDAYWKIAGEEMRLGKPWEPDWTTNCAKYVIRILQNNIVREFSDKYNDFLAFPTREMCNAFYENFKNLIEECKELL